MKKIACIVISNCTREFDRVYHYIIPDTLVDKVNIGIRVMVPFGNSNTLKEAYVIDQIDHSDFDNLKEITKIVDKTPIINCNLIKLANWMKKRFICTYYDAIKCMIPPGIGVKSYRIIKLINYSMEVSSKGKIILDLLVNNGDESEYDILREVSNIKNFSKVIKDLQTKNFIEIRETFTLKAYEKTIRVAFLNKPREEINELIQNDSIKKIQHIRVLEVLMQVEYLSINDISKFCNVSKNVLGTLKKHGFIDFMEIEVVRDPYSNKAIESTEPLLPTRQQENAINIIKKKLNDNCFSEVLLHGVTGSGKTEVYLQLIEDVIQKDKQSIVLVPEISLTPQMVERFKGRFGDFVAIIHSRLSLGERYDQWRMIRDNKVKVVVGARSAIFAPVSDLGIIIIDEEHESSYKSEMTPKYSAKDVAKMRCILEKAVLIYGSATPSVETFYKAQNGNMELIEMTERANNLSLPKIEVIDMRKELDEGNRSIFSRKLQYEISKNIDVGQQTMLFLNKRGFSSFVLCRNCGYTIKCYNCNVSLTYHSVDDRLICHYCGYTNKNPKLCPKCKSKNIRYFGIGTQKVEEELKTQFQNASVIRMDMDTTTSKNSHEAILSEFRNENVNVMIGTQMIAKGHDFPNVTLVGVLAADSMLNLGDYRAAERTFQLLTQVAGRAGRGEILGRVVIQTYNTEDYSIVSACNQDYSSFYNQEIMLRKKLKFPPFTNLGLMIISGSNDKLVFNWSKSIFNKLNELFEKYGEKVEILGPGRSPLSKIKNKYRWRIVVKSENIINILNAFTEILDSSSKKRKRSKIDISVDVNPVNML